MDINKYAHGIISVQLGINHKSRDCQVLVIDPKIKEGYSWIGGFFRANGNLYDAVEESVMFETGAKIRRGSLKLTRIVYSRTAVNNRWIANHCFSARATPIEEWESPGNKDFSVGLFETNSFSGETPVEIEHIRGRILDGGFKWAINDGNFIGKMAACDYLHRGEYCHGAFSAIPVVNVSGEGKTMPYGFGLNVGSVIIPHTFKGKRGRVVIKNRDSEHYANVGGKVEVFRGIESANIDVHSCIAREASEEIGVGLHAVSIVGVSCTPWSYLFPNDDVQPGGLNCVLDTCIRARPVNPKQLDEVIENNIIPVEEKEKIEGIYFIPRDEYILLLNQGKMRTPDMIPLARQEFCYPPSQRPSLEGIVVLKDEEYSAGFSMQLLDDNGGLLPETTAPPD